MAAKTGKWLQQRQFLPQNQKRKIFTSTKILPN